MNWIELLGIIYGFEYYRIPKKNSFTLGVFFVLVSNVNLVWNQFNNEISLIM